MIKIRIADFLGQQYATDAEEGEKVFSEICNILRRGHPVEIDFSETVIASTFLNHAIGQLVRVFSIAELNEKVHLTGLSESELYLVKLVIKNAKSYYSELSSRKIKS